MARVSRVFGKYIEVLSWVYGVKKGWSPCHHGHFLQNRVFYEKQ